MNKQTILDYLKANPNLTLVELNEGLGTMGDINQVGAVGWMVGQMLRDKQIVRNDKDWTLRVAGETVRDGVGEGT